jgi:hypothetical protein
VDWETVTDVLEELVREANEVELYLNIMNIQVDLVVGRSYNFLTNFLTNGESLPIRI